jgi:hypothetical protein
MIAYPNQYDKIVIVCYPPGAGGKFLINNLGLNDQAVFQDFTLVQKQMERKFTYQNKIDYLFDQLQQSSKNLKWNDLNLGCEQLFGINPKEYQIDYPEQLTNRFPPEIKKAISKKLCLFLVAHDTLILRSILNFWSNARVIGFSNYSDFINQRWPNGKSSNERLNYWNTVRGDNWPIQPPTIRAEFLELPDAVRHELIDFFNNDEIATWFFENELIQIQNELGNRFFQVDTDIIYKDAYKFLENLKKCLQWLELPMPLNENDNFRYFQVWKETIDLIAKFYDNP